MPNRYMYPIQTITTTTSSTTIDFTSIPQSYTDLKLIASIRSVDDASQVIAIPYIILNGNTSIVYSDIALYGSGAGGGGGTNATGTTSGIALRYSNGQNTTANMFANCEIYISNYTDSNRKTVIVDSVNENFSSAASMATGHGIWYGTSAITSITINGAGVFSDSIATGSTFTLYGISNYEKIQSNLGGFANGGEIYQDASYWYHVFKQSGTFTPRQAVTADVLVIAGGGAGGRTYGGGGGAGGLLCYTSQSLSVSTNYQVTVGNGGVYPASAAAGGDGGNSSFGALTAATGGGGGGYSASGPVSAAGRTGGSGGGGAGGFASTNGASGTSGQGNAGGNGTAAHSASAGGGGAGGAGANSATGGVGGKGGDGVSTFSSWAIATGTGLQNDGLVPSPDYTGTRYFAAGGGGAGTTQTAPSNGSGGFYMGGMSNTGQGSSGDSGRNGGSGIVIVRYAK